MNIERPWQAWPEYKAVHAVAIDVEIDALCERVQRETRRLRPRLTKKRIAQADQFLRARVPLDAQAVPWSVQDALDELVRFGIAKYEYHASSHTDHSAPCAGCFWASELESMIVRAESLLTATNG